MALSRASFSTSHPCVEHSLKKTSSSVLMYGLKILVSLSEGPSAALAELRIH